MTTTNPDFWDCNCKDNFIHPKTRTGCYRCGATWVDNADQPDSMVSELLPPQEEGVCSEPCDFYRDLYSANEATQVPDRLTKEKIEKHLGQKIDDLKYERILGHLADKIDQFLDFFFDNGLIREAADLLDGEYLDASETS